jgi:hypothetical protein
VIAFARIVLLLLADLVGLLRLATRPRQAIAAENLVLRRQLALYKERGVTPRRIDAATRVSLAWWSRWCDWRSCLIVVRPENRDPLAPGWVATVVALQVASGTPAHSAGTSPTDSPHGHGKLPLG